MPRCTDEAKHGAHPDWQEAACALCYAALLRDRRKARESLKRERKENDRLRAELEAVNTLAAEACQTLARAIDE